MVVSELKSFNWILKRELHVNCLGISKCFKTICLAVFVLSCECQKKNTWKINQLNLYLSPQNQGQENLFFHTISSLNSNSLETLGLKEPEVKESASKNDSYVIYILFHSDKKKLVSYESIPDSNQCQPRSGRMDFTWARCGPIWANTMLLSGIWLLYMKNRLKFSN